MPRYRIPLPPDLPIIYVDLLLRTFSERNIVAYLEAIPGSVAIVIDTDATPPTHKNKGFSLLHYGRQS